MSQIAVHLAKEDFLQSFIGIMDNEGYDLAELDLSHFDTQTIGLYCCSNHPKRWHFESENYKTTRFSSVDLPALFSWMNKYGMGDLAFEISQVIAKNYSDVVSRQLKEIRREKLS